MSNIGRKLLGYCFGTHEPKWVEAEGRTWIAVRLQDGKVKFEEFDNNLLKERFLQDNEEAVNLD